AAARLCTGAVESGVVPPATWQVIRMLPPAVRAQYEALTADAIVLYPRRLVARDAAEYDALVARHRSAELPWSAALDLEKLELAQRHFLDAEYVALRFDVGGYATKVGEFRRRARQEEGKGSGLELAWKAQANTMYGGLASPHHPTHNGVAAN